MREPNASSSDATGVVRRELDTVVPQTVPQLPFESVEKGPELEDTGARKIFSLEAVRENLAERGGFEPPVQVLARTTV